MNAFTSAIQTGLEEAQRSDNNIREIRKAVDDVCEAIEASTNGLIIAELRSPYKAIYEKPVVDKSYNALLGFVTQNASTEKKDLFLVNAKTGKEEVLARFEFSEHGYPCAITFERTRITCRDKNSLINVLKDMLSSPNAGRMILQLQNLVTGEGDTK